MKNIKRSRIITSENLIIIFVWLLLFMSPVLTETFSDNLKWGRVFGMWREFGFIFLVFLINRLLLVPYLFFKGKRVLYFLSVFSLIIINITAVFFLFHNNQERESIKNQHELIRKRREQGLAPHPPREGFRPRKDRPRPPKDANNSGPSEHRNFPKAPKGPAPPLSILFIFSILILGFDVGLLFHKKMIESNEKKLIVEKEGVKNKMAFLQNQISPHFFMNTLNNIHALIDISSEVAQEAVIKLSNMMSYMLYESQTDTVSIRKEFEFIESYVELMKIRCTDDIDIVLDIPSIVSDIKIPPLLTLSYIENAFKHGVSYEQKSFIHISFKIVDNSLNFSITNSINNIREKSITTGSGIGIENTKNRLDLIYADNYNLKVGKLQDDIFEVTLRVPL